jgi:DnaK suppressor protein
VLTSDLAKLVRFRHCNLLIHDPSWFDRQRSVQALLLAPRSSQMTIDSYVSSADRDDRSVVLPDDVAVRLHALLLSQRNDAAAQLEGLATTQDPALIDEHAEISATVAGETLRDVEYALSRVDAGTYGSCEACGAAIPVERLEAIPHATACINCAEAVA